MFNAVFKYLPSRLIAGHKHFNILKGCTKNHAFRGVPTYELGIWLLTSGHHSYEVWR